MVNLCTGSQILNYAFMSMTYIGFYHACEAQGIDRKSFTYRSWFQPYSAYFVCFMYWCVVGIMGYDVFMPGQWSVDSFLYSYIMLFVSIVVFILWKVIKRTKFIKPSEADLTTGLEEIERHEYEYYAQMEAASVQQNKWKAMLHWIF